MIRGLLQEIADAAQPRRERAQQTLEQWARTHLGEVERALASAARADEGAMREAAATGLAITLGAVSCFERTRIVCEWAVSANRWHRLAVARALRQPVYCLGMTTAIGMLAADAHRVVREAAVAAAAAHLVQAPRSLCRIIRARCGDPSRRIRARAVRALQTAAELGSLEAIDALGDCATADDPDTATLAVDALAAMVQRDPSRVMLALARVTAHSDKRDPRVLDRVIEDVSRVAAYAPAAASRVLHNLDHHSEWWLRDHARLAALRVDELP